MMLSCRSRMLARSLASRFSPPSRSMTDCAAVPARHSRPSPRSISCLLSSLQYLYTLKVVDQQKADKISQSFPAGLKKEEL